MKYTYKSLCVHCGKPIELHEEIHYSWNDDKQEHELHEECKNVIHDELNSKKWEK